MDPSATSMIVRPGRRDGTVLTEEGEVLPIPGDWALLPPGDAGLTRRVKAAGPTWTVKEKRGRRMFSRGLWASRSTIEAERARIDRERATPEYRKKLAAGRARRSKEQAAYVREFEGAVRRFLGFHPTHRDLEGRLARAIAEHATPVGSGTVARTKRIPVERRAEAAVIAWMRHQTTAYDHLRIERRKGRRREVRRELAAESRALLKRYRRGEDVANCPLRRALAESATPVPPPVERAPASARRPRPVAAPEPRASAPAPAPAPAVSAAPATAVSAPPDPDDREARLAAIRARARRRR